MTNLVQYYDSAYDSFLGSTQLMESVEVLKRETTGFYQWILEAKTKFYPQKDWEDLKVAEFGGGVGALSVFLAKLGAEVTLVDFSQKALAANRELARIEGVEIQQVLGDVSTPELDFSQKFDLIIDSHLIHCLTLEAQRVSYLDLVKNNLNPDGIFIGETMVFKKKLFFPEGYKFDAQNVLWQMLGSWVPVRKIADSLDLEDEFRKSELNITFFYYYAHYSFVPTIDFWDIPGEILPACVRFVLTNKG